jgi:hypothetical protein
MYRARNIAPFLFIQDFYNITENSPFKLVNQTIFLAKNKLFGKKYHFLGKSKIEFKSVFPVKFFFLPLEFITKSQLSLY